MQLEQMPSEKELGAAYAEAESEDYVGEEEGQRATARVVLDRVEAHIGTGRILDLGCWVGFLLSESKKRGWEAVGVEPSEFASAYAREQLGLDVRKEDLFDADLGRDGFQAVFMGDVIEHIPAADEALDRVNSLLAPGGVLALALPNAGSRVARTMGRRWWSVIPTHVHYFTRNSIATLLKRRGFEVIEITTSPKAFTVRYYLERIGGYSKLLGRGLVRGAEAIGVADRIWAPDFRDRMLVLARPEASGESASSA